MAMRTCFNPLLYREITVRESCVVVGIVLVVSIGGTYLAGSYSRIYLVPSGTFCFYEFDSPVIVYWFTPIMVTALGCMCYWYFSIFITTKRILDAAGSSDDTPVKLAKKSVVYVLIFAGGWLPAVIYCFYAVSVHGNVQAFDITVGVFGSLHSDVVPLVYGCFNQRIKRRMERLWDASKVSAVEKVKTEGHLERKVLEDAGQSGVTVPIRSVSALPSSGSDDEIGTEAIGTLAPVSGESHQKHSSGDKPFAERISHKVNISPALNAISTQTHSSYSPRNLESPSASALSSSIFGSRADTERMGTEVLRTKSVERVRSAGLISSPSAVPKRLFTHERRKHSPSSRVRNLPIQHSPQTLTISIHPPTINVPVPDG